MAPFCPLCNQPLPPDIEQPAKGYGWCPNCSRAFEAPPRTVPPWVLGVVVLLFTMWHFGV